MASYYTQEMQPRLQKNDNKPRIGILYRIAILLQLYSRRSVKERIKGTSRGRPVYMKGIERIKLLALIPFLITWGLSTV